MNRAVPKNEEYLFEGKVAIVQTDLNGNITFANRKFCEVSGYALDELLGSNISITKHPQTHKSTFEEMWNTLKSGQVYSGMLKNLRKDGLHYWVDIEIAPIFNKQGQMTGYISVSKPSPRKNIQENEKLQQNSNNQ